MPAPRLLLLTLLCACLPGLARAQAENSGVYLTWRDDPATTITVNWLNLYADAPATAWNRRPGGEWRRVGGTAHPVRPSGLWVRRVQLRELSPDTGYEVALGAQPPAGTATGYPFRTMPREFGRPLSFVTGGDLMHSREMVDVMNKQAGRLDPDFALIGVDLAYANNVDATRLVDFFQSGLLQDFFQSGLLHARGRNGRLIPMVSVIGNHEVVGGYRGRPEVEAS